MFFTWPTTDSLEDEWERRNKAVAAGIQYCGFQEGGPLRGRPKRSAPSDDEDQVPSRNTRKRTTPEKQPTASWGKEHDSTREHILSAEKPLTCFQCFKKYSDYNGVKRHFKTSHLMDRKCNFCDLSVLHEMHLRRHAQDVHRLKTWDLGSTVPGLGVPEHVHYPFLFEPIGWSYSLYCLSFNCTSFPVGWSCNYLKI